MDLSQARGEITRVGVLGVAESVTVLLDNGKNIAFFGDEVNALRSEIGAAEVAKQTSKSVAKEATPKTAATDTATDAGAAPSTTDGGKPKRTTVRRKKLPSAAAERGA